MEQGNVHKLFQPSQREGWESEKEKSYLKNPQGHSIKFNTAPLLKLIQVTLHSGLAKIIIALTEAHSSIPKKPIFFISL